MEIKKTKIPFLAAKEPFRAKKISYFNNIIILNIFFLKNKKSKNNKYKKIKNIKKLYYIIMNLDIKYEFNILKLIKLIIDILLPIFN